MGSIMVYRHRPMRVCPTITTSRAIVGGLLHAFFGDIMSVGGEGQQGKGRFYTPVVKFSFVSLCLFDIIGKIWGGF